MSNGTVLMQPAERRAWSYALAFLAAWLAFYANLTPIADRVVSALPLERGSRLAEAVHFFVFDTPKVLLLLTLIVFAMGVIQTFFSPERTRALLTGRREGVGNVMAAGLGIVTPFCSCSAVPLFMGFLMAGVPMEAPAWSPAASCSWVTYSTGSCKEVEVRHIKVLGTGCANCRNTLKLIEEVAAAKGVAIELEKVEDLPSIMKHGVMSTPGVVIDGKVVHAGGVPDRRKVEGWL